jgi:prepilin-type N-terminal cleavage/methylation domain-containing protein
MLTNRGFTLIEALITVTILLTGSLAVATLFAFGIETNLTNRQRITATLLVSEKLEQFKSTPLTDPLWNADAFDLIPDGNHVRYRRQWRISGEMPRKVTIIVSIGQKELIRATTLVSE